MYYEPGIVIIAKDTVMNNANFCIACISVKKTENEKKKNQNSMISDPKYYEEKIGRIKKRSLSTSLPNTFFCICNLRAGPCLKFLCMPLHNAGRIASTTNNQIQLNAGK